MLYNASICSFFGFVNNFVSKNSSSFLTLFIEAYTMEARGENMDNDKTIRLPKQKRSIQMKEKILGAAMRLICEKGYFETTTNEIAKEAGISIGSLYSYFSDKDAILGDLLERHHAHFTSVFETLNTEMNVRLYSENPREWLQRLVQKLVDLHQSVKDFNRALDELYYAKPDVAAVLDSHMEEIRAFVLDLLRQNAGRVKVKDLEAASVAIVDFINALVDRIVFKATAIEAERILDVGVDMLYSACFCSPGPNNEKVPR